ncbi:MAG: hypothetical protein ACLPKT_15860, partial [Methylocella sp.]
MAGEFSFRIQDLAVNDFRFKQYWATDDTPFRHRQNIRRRLLVGTARRLTIDGDDAGRHSRHRRDPSGEALLELLGASSAA